MSDRRESSQTYGANSRPICHIHIFYDHRWGYIVAFMEADVCGIVRL